MLGWLYQGRDFGDRSDLTELQRKPMTESTEEKAEEYHNDNVLLKSLFDRDLQTYENIYLLTGYCML